MTDGADRSGYLQEESYRDAVGFLSSALRFGIDPSLEGIGRLVDALGEPQGGYGCLQVAGTNGKSSTARLLAALLHAEGFRVGLYTSPHLVEYPERFEVNGAVISHRTFTRAVDEVRAVASRLSAAVCPEGAGERLRYDERREKVLQVADGRTFTEFEYLTAMALLVFAWEQVDFAVLEVGLGGRWDATSIVDPAVATVCGIGLDHQGILGETEWDIAREKAAIIKPASAAVLGPRCTDTRAVFYERAESVHAQVRTVSPFDAPSFIEVPDELQAHFRSRGTSGGLEVDVQGYHGLYEGLLLPHAPAYQAENVACAVASAECCLGRALDRSCIHDALMHVRFPGRFEQLQDDPPLIIDAAHNPQGACVLADAIERRFDGERRPTLLLAVLSDKDAEGIVDALVPHVGHVAVTCTSSPRALSPEELAVLVRGRTGVDPQVFPSPDEALQALLVDGAAPVVATGSITLAGEIKGLFN
ncbi:MAG: cyanophycin synthetase [Actinomycetota bacterium]|nr:cyanophycin synthetase [Actinomycetota bacterium]